MTDHKIEFTPPKGVVPEGVSAGEEFDAVSTFRVKDGGEICLVQIGDVKMPGYGDREGDSKPGYEKEAKEVAQSGMMDNNGGY